MNQVENTPTISERNEPQHALLIAWGHFAQEIRLLEALGDVPMRQKSMPHKPQEKLTEFFIGLLSGIEYLTDLSEGPAPVAQDSEVARAWQLGTMANASGVSRTLKAGDERTAAALQAALDTVAQPFLERAISDLRARGETLILDAALTGRPGSSTSTTYPGAALGYMDGEVRWGGINWPRFACRRTCLDGNGSPDNIIPAIP